METCALFPDVILLICIGIVRFKKSDKVYLKAKEHCFISFHTEHVKLHQSKRLEDVLTQQMYCQAKLYPAPGQKIFIWEQTVPDDNKCWLPLESL